MLILRTVTSIDAFEALQPFWNEILSSLPNHQIFQTFEWNFIWWRHFGNEFNLHIVVIEKDRIPIGILPLMFSTQVLGFIRWRKFEFIGKNVSNTADIILLADEDRDEAIQLLYRTLYAQMDWLDYVILRLIPDESILLSVFKINRIPLPILALEDESSYRVQLNGTWEQYLKEKLSKKLKYDINRQQRRLNELDGLQYQECRTEKEIADGLKALYRMKIAQSRALKERSFYEDEAFSQFDQNVARTFIKMGWLFMHTIRVNGKIIAVNFDFKYRDHVYCHEIAYLDAFKKYSPGRLLQFFEIKKSFELNIKIFDFAWEDTYYKRKWCNDEKKTKRIYLLRKDLLFQRFYLYHFRPILKFFYLNFLSPGMRQKAKKCLGVDP